VTVVPQKSLFLIPDIIKKKSSEFDLKPALLTSRKVWAVSNWPVRKKCNATVLSRAMTELEDSKSRE
jgi:hypothetical protein